ncbi:hypothetical protein UlMin_032956 [Ulmus minor]
MAQKAEIAKFYSDYLVFLRWLWRSTWARGSRYRGQYMQGRRHGFGFANGHRYEGAWHEGRQGLRMYTFRNGETQSGKWKNEVLNVPSMQNSTYLYHF